MDDGVPATGHTSRSTPKALERAWPVRYGLLQPDEGAVGQTSTMTITMINSHDKSSAVRDASEQGARWGSVAARATSELEDMVLIIGETTRLDTDWVPLLRSSRR